MVVRDQARKSEIASALDRVRSEIPQEVSLIVVTKNFPTSDLEILFELGIRDFAENRLDELISKRGELESDIDQEITWHYQGKIQSKKIQRINKFVDVLHSFDTPENLEKFDPHLKVFLQINLDLENSADKHERQALRSGVDPEDAVNLAREIFTYFKKGFRGVMGVSPHHKGVKESDKLLAFQKLAAISSEIQEFAPGANSISAGMSDDYQLAIAAGATHIRLGSSILGTRSAKA
jgi:pyridoxal phosphate enzyme (YggS family)